MEPFAVRCMVDKGPENRQDDRKETERGDRDV